MQVQLQALLEGIATLSWPSTLAVVVVAVALAALAVAMPWPATPSWLLCLLSTLAPLAAVVVVLLVPALLRVRTLVLCSRAAGNNHAALSEKLVSEAAGLMAFNGGASYVQNTQHAHHYNLRLCDITASKA